MRRLAYAIILLGCLPGCIPAKIVEADGPQVTYSWNGQDTELNKVYRLAINYCNSWNAPPELAGDKVSGDLHTTTFVCRSRGTLPFGQSPAGKLINRF